MSAMSAMSAIRFPGGGKQEKWKYSDRQKKGYANQQTEG